MSIRTSEITPHGRAGVARNVIASSAQSFSYLNILGLVLSFTALIVTLRLSK